MSNPIRYDAVLVRALAAELNARLAGRQAHSAPVFAADLSAKLQLDRGEALRLDLHPTRGWLRIVASADGGAARDLAARIVRVSAPADERILRIDLREGNRFRGGARSLVVELHTNQWNALLVDSADRRIVSILRSREAGGRVLRTGEVYAPPSPRPRYDSSDGDEALAEWTRSLEPVPIDQRRGELLRHFAWTSPLNADAVLGEAASDASAAALETAFGRWWEVRAGGAEPVLLEMGSALQPYPTRLMGIESRSADSLLDAMEAVATTDALPSTEAPDTAALRGQAEKRLEAARRRVAKLESELASAGEAERLRARGDLLLAHLHLVPAGASVATLPGFDGGEVEVPLDPALRPHENAERWYAEARRRARAEERLPALIQAATAETGRWEDAVRALDSGEVPGWLEGALRRPERRPASAKADAGERRPYRVYRTSGGLEVRVGRTSRDNDRLTFGHSAPGDVWLHAHSVPGSHVVLRWTADDAPPSRDLQEAAVLAAIHSRARSSGTVAVDWTRRRYVRKPRGAPPGRVSVLQAKTLFVEPDAAVEERLREAI